MQTQVQAVEPIPPKLIASFVIGFNTVANHVVLILFPMVLDLFLWFGPHLGVKNLLQPYILQLTTIPELNTPDMSSVIQTIQSSWTFLAERFNLASGLRTYPVGIPSLMSGLAPLQTPFGTAPVYQVSSPLNAIGWYIVIALLGLIVGSWYFNSVAQAVFPQKANASLHLISWDTLQVIFLTITLLLFLVVLSIPGLILLPLLVFISPGFAQITLLLLLIILVWLIVPLLFSPHGIFVYRQSALVSLMTSAKVIRFSMPGSVIFFFLVLVISQGMDLLWQVPPDNSWMVLVGIAGHAFTTTGLLAASFVYYGDAVRWLQEVIQHNLPSQKESQI
jgi:hypothetical protein